MRILSIETSCDDTCISIFEATGDVKNATFKLLANQTNSQINTHIPYGGVYPMLAKREHIKNLPIALEACLKEAKLDKKDVPVDAIAVTYGPGLEIALWTGIVFAKELAQKWNVPLIPVNHMEGHIFSVFGKSKPYSKFSIPKVATPTLSLLVSGGHTQLVVSKKWMEYEVVGETLDDAVGEAFDKVARMLGLPYPGGPQISKLAEEERGRENQGLKNKSIFSGSLSDSAESALPLGSPACETPRKNYLSFSLPRPMLYSKNLDFSFSGLKTAVLYLIKDLGGAEKLSDKTKSAIALEFENAAIECLIYKTAKAIEKYKIKTIIVGGGVSANKHLRGEMKKLAGKKVKLLFPEQVLSMDNSIMIGIAGYVNYIKNKKKVPKIGTVKATGNLRL